MACFLAIPKLMLDTAALKLVPFVADTNGDGIPDIIVGRGPGSLPEVKVFNGLGGALVQDYFAYDPGFLGGIFVAAGDVNGDGKADVITGPGLGGLSFIRVFSGAGGALLRQLAYPLTPPPVGPLVP